MISEGVNIVKRIIRIYIKSFKLGRRFLKTQKAMNTLLKEYDNIDKVDVDMRREYLKCLKFFNKYATGILDEMKYIIN